MTSRTGLRSLLVCPWLPSPSGGGGDLRNWQMTVTLSQLGAVAVFGIGGPLLPAPSLDGLEAWAPSGQEGLTSNRQMRPDRLEWARRPDGHPSDDWYSAAAAEQLEAMTRSFQPDLVVISHIWCHGYLECFPRGSVRRILLSHNVEAVLHEHLTARIRPSPLLGMLDRRTALLERRVVQAVEGIWACSDVDAAAFAQLYEPAALVSVVPNCIDTERFEEPDRGVSRIVIFPATFNYPPNSEAASFLVREVLPLLAEAEPAVSLHLVGHDPSEEMLRAAERDPRVVVSGAVGDVRGYLAKASVMAVALFAGSGTRYKALEAFAAKVPVVSTAKGVEGLGVVEGRHFLQAEDPAAFVAQIKKVWDVPELARALTQEARELVTERYSFAASVAATRAALEALPTAGEPSS